MTIKIKEAKSLKIVDIVQIINNGRYGIIIDIDQDSELPEEDTYQVFLFNSKETAGWYTRDDIVTFHGTLEISQ